MGTSEGEYKLTLGTSEVAAALQLTTPRLTKTVIDTFFLSSSPLTPEPMKDAEVSAAPGPVVEPLQFRRF